MDDNPSRKSTTWLLPAGAVACWLVCGGELLTEHLFGRAVPGYDSWRQTVSFLGKAGSPVAGWVAVWGVVFSMLFVFFSQGFRLAFAGQGRAAVAASWLILAYGLGEGIDSPSLILTDPLGSLPRRLAGKTGRKLVHFSR